jgi:hypothetical protein
MAEYDADQFVWKVSDRIEEHERVEMGACFLFGPTRHKCKQVFDKNWL